MAEGRTTATPGATPLVEEGAASQPAAPTRDAREAVVARQDAVDAEYRKRADDMRRIEERLGQLELRVEGIGPRTELGALRDRVDGLDEQLRALEKRLGG